MKNTLLRPASLGLMVLALILTVSCGKDKFHIVGEITNAKDSTLFLEHNGLDGFTRIDSVKLGEDGSFSFDGDRPDNPEFYRLRIAGQIINVSIDSTETVTVKAKWPQMATDYTVEGSTNCSKIRELALKQINLQWQAQQIADNPNMSADSSLAVINRLVDAYKRDVEVNYIFKEPMKAYAYFALFQYITVGSQSQLIFDPRRDPKDIKVFGAVATSWDMLYPKSERGKNLHNIAIEGMKNQRIVKSEQQTVQIDPRKVQETGVIDLPLYDNNGHKRSLTEFKGKVILICFHDFSAQGSTQFIMSLRDLYNKYHQQGLEIYMVGLDENEHFWKTQTANLPWVNVYDDTGVSNVYTSVAQSFPIFYLVDRNNNVVRNPSTIGNVEQTVKSYL